MYFLFTFSGAIYISTECAFPSKRLAQLVDYYNHTDPTFPADCMSNIVVEHAIDAVSMKTVFLMYIIFI